MAADKETSQKIENFQVYFNKETRIKCREVVYVNLCKILKEKKKDLDIVDID